MTEPGALAVLVASAATVICAAGWLARALRSSSGRGPGEYR